MCQRKYISWYFCFAEEELFYCVLDKIKIYSLILFDDEEKQDKLKKKCH